MFIFYILIFAVSLYGIRIRQNNIYVDDYLSKDSTNAIKGIWILFVFLRHANQYVLECGYDYSKLCDRLFFLTDGLLAQLIVVMFFFFSGYGVFRSILCGGERYINSIPKRRILTTLINFDIAVLFYLVVAFIVNSPLSLDKVLLSFIGWEEIGNSNWYIFVIIICYFTTFLSFTIVNKFKGKHIEAIYLNLIFIAITILLLINAGKPHWWYDTVMAYPLGMMFGLYRKEFDGFISKQSIHLVSLLVSALSFCLSYIIEINFNINSGFVYWLLWIIRVVSFILLNILIVRRLSIRNGFLVWAGSNLFPLYIYQRLPMIMLAPSLAEYPYIYIPVTFFISCALVFGFKHIQIRLI